MWALLRKDLLLEFRTKDTLAALLLLGLLTLLVLSFAFDPTSDLRIEAAPGVLWVALVFAGVLGLSRAFLAERENDCLHGLLLCPIDPATIYLAKVLSNVTFMLLAQAVVCPVFILFFNVPLTLAWSGIFLSLLLGIIGFSALGTLFSAIAVRTRAREVMLPLLLIPLVVPLFLAGVKVTAHLLAGKPMNGVAPWLNLMVGFDVIFLVVSWMLFEYVVDE